MCALLQSVLRRSVVVSSLGRYVFVRSSYCIARTAMHHDACPAPAFRVVPASTAPTASTASLAEQLKTFSKSQLKHQQTSVTYQSGKRLLVDGDVVIEEGANHTGYVVDTKPDQHCYKVLPALFMGSQDCVTDALQLQQLGITHVLNLVPDLQPLYPSLFQYLTVPVLDVAETDLLAVLPQCVEWIRQGRAAGGVVVHCNAGVSRSASVTVAALMHFERWPLAQALAHLKAIRPAIQPNQGFLLQLARYEQLLHDRAV